MDNPVNDFIYHARKYGELSGSVEWLRDAQKILLAKFGVKLSRNAIKKRYYRMCKSEPQDNNECTTHESGNIMNASYVSASLGTLDIDTLYKQWNINKDDWEPVKQSHSEWESPVGDGVQLLHSVRAEFVRKEPVAQWPVVQPLMVDLNLEKPNVTTASTDMQTAIVCGDAHVWYDVNPYHGCKEPYHDEGAMNIVLQIISDVKPTLVLLLGDMFDLPTFTDKFIRTPQMMFGFKPALKYMHEWLVKIRIQSPETQIVFIEGNHCKRIENSILRNLVAAYELVVGGLDGNAPVTSIEHLLGLSELGIEYIGPYPDGRYWINENLVAEHGTVARKGSGDTVKSVLREARNSVIFGHAHRLESASITVFPRRGSRTYKAMSPGCLCHIDGRVPAQGSRQNWQQGFAYIEYMNGNDIFSDTLVNVYGNRCIFRGKVYESCLE